MVLAFELGPDCAGQCTAGAWHISHHDISSPAQSFPVLFPLPGTFFPTHPTPTSLLKVCFTAATLPSLTTSPPATGDPSIVRDFFLLYRPTNLGFHEGRD